MPNASTPNEQSNADSHALLSAVEDGDAARVEHLLAEGARADAALRGGETSLMRAAARGHEDVARVLLDAGADVNARRADGFTPLVLAVFFGHEEVVRLLIERDADVSAQTRLGTTAESWAASRGFAGIAELLRDAEYARPSSVVKKRVEIESALEVVKASDAESVRAATIIVDTTISDAAFKTANAGASKPVGFREVFGEVTTSDDVAKFSRAASKSVEASEPSVFDEASEPFVAPARREANAPAHPSARAFPLGGFMRSWQGSVGTALLLTALGVTVFAVWNGGRQQRVSLQPSQAAQTPTPQTLAPDASIVVTQPSPLPSPTPDAQAVVPSTGVPPEAMYPAPGTSSPQTFYVPPAASNAPSVPSVVSENGAAPAEDASRSKRKSDTQTNETTNQTSPSDKRDTARTDEGSRSGSPGRITRAPVADSPSSAPVRTSPPPAATPERRKVIQWPPQ